MLYRLKKAFGGSVNFTIETYGKLPFYKDYIAVVTSKPATQWKAFLLSFFSQDDMPIPPGSWPFIYQETPKSDLIVGLVEHSSDGIREFPFSIFTVCHAERGKMPYCLETVRGIWDKLHQLREQLNQACNISECYSIIRGKTVEVKVGSKEFVDTFTLELAGEWPRLVVARLENPSEIFLIKDGLTSPHRTIANWHKLESYTEQDH